MNPREAVIMKENQNDIIAKMLYDQAVASEIYPEELDGESLAIQEMLAEIRALGYPFHYFSDIRMRNIKDPKIMEILLKYYPRMESIVTKEDCLRKIDPKKFPIAIELALQEFDQLSPLSKQSISGFQEVIAKGKANDEYITMLLSIMELPDNYASCFLIRERLLKSAPESLKPLTVLYSRGVLLPATLKEFARYGDDDSLAFSTKVSEITENDIKLLLENQPYTLCVTMYEQYKQCCTVQHLRTEAKKLLQKSLQRRMKRQDSERTSK